MTAHNLRVFLIASFKLRRERLWKSRVPHCRCSKGGRGQQPGRMVRVALGDVLVAVGLVWAMQAQHWEHGADMRLSTTALPAEEQNCQASCSRAEPDQQAG